MQIVPLRYQSVHFAFELLIHSAPVSDFSHLPVFPSDLIYSSTCELSFTFSPLPPLYSGSALHPPCLRPLQMSLRDPTLVISSLAPARNSRSVRANNTNLITWIHLLSPGGRFASAGSVFTTAFLLREQGCDPGVVDEVDCTCEETEEEEVEEDNLRIKNTRIRLHNRNGLIERRQRIRRPLAISYHDREIQLQILRLQFGREFEFHALLLARGDGDTVTRSRQVADDLRSWRGGWKIRKRPKGSANEDDGDGGGFIVGDGENGECWVVIDEFDTEDLRGRE